MLMCVFVHSRFVENPSIGSWETNPCFLRGGGGSIIVAAEKGTLVAIGVAFNQRRDRKGGAPAAVPHGGEGGGVRHSVAAARNQWARAVCGWPSKTGNTGVAAMCGPGKSAG
jgi:hypothetical protein